MEQGEGDKKSPEEEKRERGRVVGGKGGLSGWSRARPAPSLENHCPGLPVDLVELADEIKVIFVVVCIPDCLPSHF